MKKIIGLRLFQIVILIFSSCLVRAQTITGAWKGKIKNTRVELKLIRSGDSLTGTSYYYESKKNFRRYTVKGYFDPLTNQVIWWDDMLVTDMASGILAKSLSTDALLTTADFNCPGEDKMMLDGSASLRDNSNIEKGTVQLEKTVIHVFNDEWDFIIENYTVGANDPFIMDSISNISYLHIPEAALEKEILPVTPVIRPAIGNSVVTQEKKLSPAVIATVEEKMLTRKKTLATVIPLTGDSLELRFYDNAEIDGDSIALFMNNILVLKNIRLTDQAYTLKFAVSSLENDNELVMVAENLGSIPPNTSLMVALVGDKRYEARLQSTENTSALIRLIKPR